MKKKSIILFFVFVEFNTLLFAQYIISDFHQFKLFIPSQYNYIIDNFFVVPSLLKRIKKLTGHIPKKFAYVIEDYGMYSNGITNPIYNKIFIMTHIPDVHSEIGYSKNWIQFVTLHETTHMAHLTYTSSFNNFLNKIMGNLFFPNMFVPNWYIEGIAVLSESQFNHQGRLNDGFFSAYENIILNEKHFPDILDITYNFDKFPYGTTYYLNGGNFFKYLYETYNNPFPRLFKKEGYSILSYLSPIFPFLGMDFNTKMVLGKSIPALWREYKNDKLKHLTPIKNGINLTNSGDYKYSITLQGNKLYYLEKTYKKCDVYEVNGFSTIKYINLISHSIHRVISLNSNVFEKFYVDDDRLIYGKYILKNGYENFSNDGMGYEISLFELNLKNGKSRKIYSGKIRSFTFYNGKYYICEDATGKFGTKLTCLNGNLIIENRHNLPYIIDEIKIKNDTFYFVARAKNKHFAIYKMKTKDFLPILLIGNNDMIGNIKLTNDGIIFMSNTGNEHHLYHYNFSNGEIDKISDGVFENEGIIVHNNLYYVGLNSQGFDIYLVEKYQKKMYHFKKENELAPYYGKIFYDKKNIDFKTHLLGLFPKIRIPFFLIDSNNIFYGLFAMGENTLGSLNYNLVYFNYNHENYFVSNLYSTLLKPLYIYLYSDNKKFVREFSLGLPLYFYSHNMNYSIYLSGNINNDDNNFIIEGMGNFFLELPIFTYNIYIKHSKYFYYDAYTDNTKNSQNRFEIKNSLYFHIMDKLNGRISLQYVDKSMGAPMNRLIDINCELSKRIISINKGLWNPNIYFKDFYIKFAGNYYWYIYNDFHNPQYEIRFSFIQELKTLFYLPLILNLTLIIDNNKQIKYEFYMNFSTNFFMKNSIKKLFHWEEKEAISPLRF